MVKILEVSPRDGLQNEQEMLSTATKVQLVERAVNAGATRIEVTSFVNPKAVPQLADAEDVMATIPRIDGVSLAGLVMNERGFERAIAAAVDEINVVVVASDTFCQKNQNMTTWQACDIASAVVARAREHDIFSTVTIGASFGCPFEGEVSVDRLDEVLKRVVETGPDEIALADTIGVAVPSDVIERVGLLREFATLGIDSRLHLHDTRNTAIANAVAAYESGVRTLDASIGGAGGCPFAPHATGNVATEDLVYLFNRMGVETDLDLFSLINSAEWLEAQLGKTLPSALARAGTFPL